MGFKIEILLVVILAGCFADPIPNYGSLKNELDTDTDPATRIIGGSLAPDNSVPYMAAMVQSGLWRELICGGAILTQRTVLTAAHCCDSVYSLGSLSRTVAVVVGTNLWRTGGQIYDVARNISHPHYVRQTGKNDISLLITSRNIIFSDVVVPVRPSFDFVGEDVAVRAAGWGLTVQGGYTPEQLFELTLTTVEGQRCALEMAEASINHNRNMSRVEPHIELCARHSPGHGMCYGDSGSGLVRVDNGQLVGVASWALPCARGAPDVFTRVSAFGDWVMRNIV